MNWSTRLRRWVRIRTPPVLVASMKPTAATVLPAPVACSNQKRRAAPGSSGASSTTSSSSSDGASSQSWGSSSGASSSSSTSSSSSSSRSASALGSAPASASASPSSSTSSSTSAGRSPLRRSSSELTCCCAISSASVPGERVDLVRVQFGAVAQLRRFVGEEALQPQQQGEVAAPLDRGVLGPVVELAQRRVEGTAAGGARRQRLGPLAVEQERLAGELRRTLDIGARRNCRCRGNIAGLGHRRLLGSASAEHETYGRRQVNEGAGDSYPSPRRSQAVRITSEPNVRIVITERMTTRRTLRTALSLRALRWPCVGDRLRLLRGRRLRRQAPRLRDALWPAPPHRWRRCTPRPTSCSRAARTPIEKRIASLKGYPVVANVWASWCGPCRFEFPILQKLSARYGKRVAFLGVNSQDSDDAADHVPRRGPGPLPELHRPRQEDRRLARRHPRPPRHRLLRPRRQARLPQAGPLRRTTPNSKKTFSATR